MKDSLLESLRGYLFERFENEEIPDVYVPMGSVRFYKNNKQWSMFRKIHWIKDIDDKGKSTKKKKNAKTGKAAEGED